MGSVRGKDVKHVTPGAYLPTLYIESRPAPFAAFKSPATLFISAHIDDFR
jgi:hypothetical protein